MNRLKEFFDSVTEIDKLEEKASFARLEHFANQAIQDAEMLEHAKSVYLNSVEVCDEPHDIEILSLHIESAFPDVADFERYNGVAEKAINECRR